MKRKSKFLQVSCFAILSVLLLPFLGNKTYAEVTQVTNRKAETSVTGNIENYTRAQLVEIFKEFKSSDLHKEGNHWTINDIDVFCMDWATPLHTYAQGRIGIYYLDENGTPQSVGNENSEAISSLEKIYDSGKSEQYEVTYTSEDTDTKKYYSGSDPLREYATDSKTLENNMRTEEETTNVDGRKYKIVRTADYKPTIINVAEDTFTVKKDGTTLSADWYNGENSYQGVAYMLARYDREKNADGTYGAAKESEDYNRRSKNITQDAIWGSFINVGKDYGQAIEDPNTGVTEVGSGSYSYYMDNTAGFITSGETLTSVDNNFLNGINFLKEIGTNTRSYYMAENIRNLIQKITTNSTNYWYKKYIENKKAALDNIAKKIKTDNDRKSGDYYTDDGTQIMYNIKNAVEGKSASDSKEKYTSIKSNLQNLSSKLSGSYDTKYLYKDSVKDILNSLYKNMKSLNNNGGAYSEIGITAITGGISIDKFNVSSDKDVDNFLKAARRADTNSIAYCLSYKSSQGPSGRIKSFIKNFMDPMISEYEANETGEIKAQKEIEEIDNVEVKLAEELGKKVDFMYQMKNDIEKLEIDAPNEATKSLLEERKNLILTYADYASRIENMLTNKAYTYEYKRENAVEYSRKLFGVIAGNYTEEEYKNADKKYKEFLKRTAYAYYNVQYNQGVNLRTEAAAYTAYYKTVVQGNNLGIKLNNENAKTTVQKDENGEYYYKVGPFTTNYVYSWAKTSEGNPVYWNSIAGEEIYGFNEKGEQIKLTNASLEIDKSGRNTTDADYNYAYPKGERTFEYYYENNSIKGRIKEGTGEKFYIKVPYKGNEDITSVTVQFEEKALKECKGFMAINIAGDEGVYIDYKTDEKIVDKGEESTTYHVKYHWEKGSSNINQRSQILITNINNADYAITKYYERYQNPLYPETLTKETKWKLRILKESDEGISLEGVGFNVVIKNNTQGTEEAYNAKTDSSGRIDIKTQESHPGDNITVVIHESKTLGNYKAISDKKLTIEIGANGEIAKVNGNSYSDDTSTTNNEIKVNNKNSTKVLTITIENSKKVKPPHGGGGGNTPDNSSYSLELIKTDSDTKNTLDGAKFIVNINGTDYTVTTSNGGSAIISGLRVTGDNIPVTIEEIITPNGYIKLQDKISFTYKATKNGNTYNISTSSANSDNVEFDCNDKNRIEITIKNKALLITPLRMNLGGYVFRDGAEGKANIEDGKYTPISGFDVDKFESNLNNYTNSLTQVYELQGLLEDQKNNLANEDTRKEIINKVNSVISLFNSYSNEDKTEILGNISEDLSNFEKVETDLGRKESFDNICLQVDKIQEYLEEKVENTMDEFITTGDILLGDVYVELYDSNNNLVDSTYSEGGNYVFFNLDSTKKYYTKFYYDGQDYQAIAKSLPEYNSEDWRVTSKADEIKRAEYNEKFSEIGSYPTNYKISSDTLFDKANNNIYTQTEAGIYGKVWLNADNKLSELSNEVQNYKKTHATTSIEEAYRVIGNEKNNDEDRSRLQYLYDITITAEAKAETAETGYYPVYKEFAISDKISEDGKLPIYPGQYYINLGLTKRKEFDLEVTSKKLETVEMTVNGQNETYNYSGNLTKYLETRLADVNLDDTKIKLNYKINIVNNSQTVGNVTELVDYYSKTSDGKDRYEIESVKYGKNNGETTNIEINQETIKTSKYKNAQQNIDGYTTNYIELPETKLGYKDSLQVYVTLSLSHEGLEELRKLNPENPIQTNNFVEINGYKTFNSTELTDTSSPGILDKDSIPGNLTTQLNKEDITDKNGWEDDAQVAKFANIYQEPRTLTGNVWEEDWKDNKVNEELVQYANANGIGGITVELIEIKQDKGQEVGARAWDENAGNWYKEGENNKVITTTGDDGSYSFTGYIPGKYVIKFTYGDKNTYTLQKSDSSKEENKKYSGEEYQSVRSNENTRDTVDKNGNITGYWYNTNKETRYSDAYDEVQSRQKAIDYLKDYTYYKGDLINNKDYTKSEDDTEGKAKDALTIQAYTSPLELEIEYATKNTTGTNSITTDEQRKQLRTYIVSNIDFGITRRPESRLQVEKTIKDVTITLQNGTVLIDHATPDTIANQLVEYAKQIPGRGDLYFEIDDEILHGSTLQVTYNIKVTNVGDDNELTYYKDAGGNNLAIGYYGEDVKNIIYKENGEGNIGYHQVKEGNTYYGCAESGYNKTETKPVTTKAVNILDYIQSNYTFNKDLTEDNKNWEVVRVEDIQKDDNGTLVDNTRTDGKYNIDLSTYQTILKTTGDNAISNTPLQVGESIEGTLTLTKVLTPTEDLNFENILEIVEVENTAGRVAHGSDYKETPGNLDPTKALTDTSYRTLEEDESKTSMVSITDPTGANKSNTWMLITVIAIGVLATGIVLIKKYAIDPRNNNNTTTPKE